MISLTGWRLMESAHSSADKVDDSDRRSVQWIRKRLASIFVGVDSVYSFVRAVCGNDKAEATVTGVASKTPPSRVSEKVIGETISMRNWSM